MLPKSGKIKRQSISPPILLGILLTIIIGFLIIANLKITQKKIELQSKLEFLQKEIENLERRNAELRTKITQQREENYLERVARERLNLKKPGEEVVVIIPPKEKNKEVQKEKVWWNPLTW